MMHRVSGSHFRRNFTLPRVAPRHLSRMSGQGLCPSHWPLRSTSSLRTDAISPEWSSPPRAASPIAPST